MLTNNMSIEITRIEVVVSLLMSLLLNAWFKYHVLYRQVLSQWLDVVCEHLFTLVATALTYVVCQSLSSILIVRIHFRWNRSIFPESRGFG